MTRRCALASCLLVALIGLSLPVLAQDYALDPTLNPTFSGRTHPNFDFNNVVAIQSDQKILVGGNFTIVNGDASALIVRFNPNGSRDTSFNSGLGFQANDAVQLIKLLPDGKVLVAGVFRVGGGLAFLVRLNSNGSVDNTFSAGVQGTIRSIEFYPDGRMLACGALDVGKIARLYANGELDDTFTTSITGNVCYDTAITPEGKIYVAGTLSGLDGFAIPGMARLNADGTKDTSFALLPLGGSILSYEFYRLALQPSGYLLGGYKQWYIDQEQNLSARQGLARFSPTGSAQFLSNCGDAEGNNELFLQADGKVITNMCRPALNAPSHFFGRLLPDGSFDSSINRLGFNNLVRRVARQTDGNYVVVGSFTNIDGVARQRIARLVALAPQAKHRFDFDGDGRDDVAVFRPSDRYWYVNQSTAGFSFNQWGLSTDKPVAADHDNDGKTDIAVFRDGDWYALRSSNNTLMVTALGQAGDKPFVGDMDGDGRVDLLVRRIMPNNTVQWQIRYFGATGVSAPITTGSEGANDPALIADLDGDNVDELVFYRNGTWYSRKVGVTGPLRLFFWGTAGDILTPGDYDLDGQTDTAVFRPSTGDWHINATTSGYIAVHFGATGDVPVPADYDGDGKTDIAVFRNGAWYQLLSSNGSFRGVAWGLPGDIPIPAQTN